MTWSLKGIDENPGTNILTRDSRGMVPSAGTSPPVGVSHGFAHVATELAPPGKIFTVRGEEEEMKT